MPVLREVFLKMILYFKNSIFLDEPVLVFQRNSFLGLEDEEKQTNKAVITRLFEEVKLKTDNPHFVYRPITSARRMIMYDFRRLSEDGVLHKMNTRMSVTHHGL